MKWMQAENQSKRKHPLEVIEFCTTLMLPLIVDDHITVCTEHHRHGVIFCAHPSCLHDGGQDSSVWHDWAVFNVDGSPVHCQLLCFIRIGSLQPGMEHAVQQCPVTENANHAVVRRMVSPPHQKCKSKIVNHGNLSDQLFLFDCETMMVEVAIVQESMDKKDNDKSFMVVANRQKWLNWFEKEIDEQ